MSSDTELEARDIRAGYISWCRGELPAVSAGEKFDRFIAKIREEAKAETRADFVLTRANIRKIKADALREAVWDMRAQVERATEYQRFTEHELIEDGIEHVLNEYADQIEEPNRTVGESVDAPMLTAQGGTGHAR